VKAAILTEIVRDHLKSLQANTGREARLDHGRFLAHPFEFIIHKSSYPVVDKLTAP
jgi:hypothetical protein